MIENSGVKRKAGRNKEGRETKKKKGTIASNDLFCSSFSAARSQVTKPRALCSFTLGRKAAALEHDAPITLPTANQM